MVLQQLSPVQKATWRELYVSGGAMLLRLHVVDFPVESDETTLCNKSCVLHN